MDSSDKDCLEKTEVELIAQTLVELLVTGLCQQDSAFAGQEAELSKKFRPAVNDVVNGGVLRTLVQGDVVANRFRLALLSS